jgi:predicted HTH transcriptional regulator
MTQEPPTLDLRGRRGRGDTVVGMTHPEMWRPRSEDELRAVIAAGGLEETHSFEVKQDVADGKGGGKELARDLAQFGIDGGILLIGVAESKDASPQWEPTPIPLSGLGERIEQVARSTIDPALYVRVSQFSSGVDPATGYVVVEVPASPQAPHMVDGIYYGRGDKMRHLVVRRGGAASARRTARY